MSVTLAERSVWPVDCIEDQAWKIGCGVTPSGGALESLHRREFVLLTAESREGCKQKLLPIIRTGVGGFFAFGEFEGPKATSFQGRFAQILPPNVSTADDRAKARTLLAAMGVAAEAVRSDWSGN